MIHIRRADGRQLDAVLHVNPSLETKGMAVIYNPLDGPLKGDVVLPLYYTGLKDRAKISLDDGPERPRRLDRESKLTLTVEVPAKSCVWVTIR